MLRTTDFIKRWIAIDAILADQTEAPATLGEIRACIENTDRDEDAALLILAMRLVQTHILAVYQGGAAKH